VLLDTHARLTPTPPAVETGETDKFAVPAQKYKTLGASETRHSPAFVHGVASFRIHRR
jgi:hypothetical protein